MCLYPRLIKNKKYEPNKKNGGVVPAERFKQTFDERKLLVPIGCGKCIECQKQRARNWQVRLLEEVRTARDGKFVTLTFSNESIKKLYEDEKISHLKGYALDNAAATLAIRLFLERWRKKYKKSLRHFFITELGHEGTENIHLHGVVWTSKLGEVERIWQYGYVWNGRYNAKTDTYRNYVNEQTINYITKYITKIDVDHKYYKPAVRCSPGIGANYLERWDATRNKYEAELTKEYYQNREGYKIALPTYYRNKIYSEAEREALWMQKLDKKERYVLGFKYDVSKTEEHYYNAVMEARIKNKRLGYGDIEKDWTREEYEYKKRVLLQQQRKANIKDTLPYGSKAELWAQATKANKGLEPNTRFYDTPITREAPF